MILGHIGARKGSKGVPGNARGLEPVATTMCLPVSVASPTVTA